MILEAEHLAFVRKKEGEALLFFLFTDSINTSSELKFV